MKKPLEELAWVYRLMCLFCKRVSGNYLFKWCCVQLYWFPQFSNLVYIKIMVEIKKYQYFVFLVSLPSLFLLYNKIFYCSFVTFFFPNIQWTYTKVGSNFLYLEITLNFLPLCWFWLDCKWSNKYAVIVFFVGYW